MAANPRRAGRAQSAPAWLADSAAVKPAHTGDRMRAALGADTTLAQRAVLALLAFHDGPGGSRPSADSIASLLRVTRSTVFDHLRGLQQADLVHIEQQRGPSRYHLNWARILSERAGRLNEPKPSEDAGRFSASIPSESVAPIPSESVALNRQRASDTNRKEPEIEPEAASAAAASPQAGGGGASRAAMEPEARPLPAPAGDAPAGSGREPEREPEARPRRPRHTTTFSAAAEMEERFGHLQEGSDEWKRAVDDAGMDRDRTPAEAAEYRIRRTRQLIESYEAAGRPADKLKRDLERLEAAAQAANARQGSRGAGEADT